MSDLFSRVDHGETATISDCRKYRYTLTRWWDRGPMVCWLMLNPSTANESFDDPTIRRCISFSRQWGASGICVVNLFALRSTDPSALKSDPAASIGPQNDEYILRETKGRRVIAAWGTHGTLAGRNDVVAKLLMDSGITIECLRLTKDGHPFHPLYCKANLTPIPFGFRS